MTDDEREALEAGIRTLFEAERREKGEESVAAMVALYALLKTPPVSGKEGVMTEQKHTPGPWKAIRNNAYWEVVPQNRGPNAPYTIGNVCASDPDAPDRGLQEANARLIAAAPEMLAALKSVAEWVNNPFDGNAPSINVIRKNINAAIAKAEGGDNG